MDTRKSDVAIIGGGVIGCAAACFLKQSGVERVCIIEPDPTKALALGATPIKDRVVELYVSQRRVTCVELGSGARIEADYVINAAGTWAAAIAKLVGMDLPVYPMRRFEHYVEIEQELPPMPLLKDPDRLVARPAAPVASSSRRPSAKSLAIGSP